MDNNTATSSSSYQAACVRSTGQRHGGSGRSHNSSVGLLLEAKITYTAAAAAHHLAQRLGVSVVSEEDCVLSVVSKLGVFGLYCFCYQFIKLSNVQLLCDLYLSSS
jgi:hypothetical protein